VVPEGERASLQTAVKSKDVLLLSISKTSAKKTDFKH
jgi:hypothetical protein